MTVSLKYIRFHSTRYLDFKFVLITVKCFFSTDAFFEGRVFKKKKKKIRD